jgi:hypothetical protein
LLKARLAFSDDKDTIGLDARSVLGAWERLTGSATPRHCLIAGHRHCAAPLSYCRTPSAAVNIQAPAWLVRSDLGLRARLDRAAKV